MMWIWIGVGVWYLIGIAAALLEWRMWRRKGHRYHSFEFIGTVSLGLIGLIIFGLQKGTKMKIYWDEKEQQIKTKDRKCLFDSSFYHNRLAELSDALSRVHKIESWLIEHDKESKEVDKYNDKVEEQNAKNDRDGDSRYRQLQCSAKGHGKWMYVKQVDYSYILNIGLPLSVKFVFKCSDCGLEITKTKDELKPAEKEAMKKLNLL